jgi:hypothetical protein
LTNITHQPVYRMIAFSMRFISVCQNANPA